MYNCDWRLGPLGDTIIQIISYSEYDFSTQRIDLIWEIASKHKARALFLCVSGNQFSDTDGGQGH